MKLFSRKAIAAVATSIALTTAGVAAPAIASAETVNVVAQSGTTGDTQEAGSSEGMFAGSSDKETGQVKPGELKDWIGIFTAIIGALSAAFVFFQRING
ncbi:hypothetical protein [Corynebacterium nasicanis]|uniref:Secreted protein n=1 Tax=Corynebacterium nasicanis TaxID=1448267 RepID=A0ABW1Q8W1_9CORY